MQQKISWPLSWFIPHHALLVLVLIPLAGALLVALFCNNGYKNNIKTLSFLSTLATFVMSVIIALGFDMTIERFSTHLQYADALPFKDTTYRLGINSTALYSILFVTALLLVSILYGWDMIAHDAKINTVALLLIESIIIALVTSASLVQHNASLPIPLSFTILAGGMFFITRKAK